MIARRTRIEMSRSSPAGGGTGAARPRGDGAGRRDNHAASKNTAPSGASNSSGALKKES